MARRRSVSIASRVTARTCMEGWNTACRALPPALASYMAASASRSSASGRSGRAAPVAIPMLAGGNNHFPERPHAHLAHGGHARPRPGPREQLPGGLPVVRLDELRERTADEVLGRVA